MLDMEWYGQRLRKGKNDRKSRITPTLQLGPGVSRLNPEIHSLEWLPATWSRRGKKESETETPGCRVESIAKRDSSKYATYGRQMA